MGGMALGAALCARYLDAHAQPARRLRRDRGRHRRLRARIPRGVRRRDRLVVRDAAARRSVRSDPRWTRASRARREAGACLRADPAAIGAARRDLPADERGPGARVGARPGRARAEPVAMLYFTNSLGAAAGVLASGFVLIAWVGAARHAAHRGRRQPRARRAGRAARAPRCARRPSSRAAHGGDEARPRACCSASPCSRAWPRSSTRSAGSACSRWCWAPRRIPSS